MTTTTLLKVATIIATIMLAFATLLAPTVAEIVKSRISQPTPKPEAKQQNKRAPLNFRRYFWPVLSIGVTVYCLVTEMNNPAPIARHSILLISLSVAGFVSALVVIVLELSFSKILGLIERLVNLHEAQVQMITFSTVEVVRLAKLFDNVPPIPDPPPDNISPLLKSIKRALGLV